MASGPISADVDDLLREFVHPPEQEEETIHVSEEAQSGDPEEEERESRPWWRRPSPLWIIFLLPFTGVAHAATKAPRVEVYTTLICRENRPDIFPQGGFPFSGIDKACYSDPVVSAEVARLVAIMTTIAGVLSCLTTAWWGAFSDRNGRIRTLGISLTEQLVTDAVHILVYYKSEWLPGGYWFLLVGAVIEGILGANMTAGAAKHAYFADTTTPASRSRMFSISTGIMYIGSALGPAMGGLITRYTQNLISVFYAALFAHIIYACMVWFIIPESLTSKQMSIAAEKQRERAIRLASSKGLKPRLKRWFKFLSDLSVFGPASSFGSSPKSHRRWSLTCMAISYALVMSLVGSANNKVQYASTMFGWTSETIAYWLSFTGAIRSVFLAIVLPLLVKCLKKKPKTRRARPPRSDEEQPLIDGSQSKVYGPSPRPPLPSKLKEAQTSRLDLRLARISLGLMIISYVGLCLDVTSFSFIIYTMIEALGAGYGPAIQSVALSLYGRKSDGETGRFFSALSILQALCSQILGPLTYGVVYAETVGTYPQMIFLVSAACLGLSFISLVLVRLPRMEKVF
ncbi:MFS general substrate transporter [Marasmius fiardii PR-910]|nr:MFS general substrate transporter [Marasmius fiardii PR-910]